MVWSSQAPKWPILVIFCRMDHQKSNFLLIYGTSFYRRLLRPGYVIFLKTFWWNSNAQTSGTYRYLHYNLKVVFSWPPKSSKSVNMSWNTLYIKFEKKSGYNQDEIWLNGHERVFQHQMMIPMLSKLEILQSFQQLTKVITNQFMSQKQAHLHPLVGYFY